MALSRYFQNLIAIEGPITVARFMQDALLHPVLGYYTIRDPFGETGDFITAPEISQMFGELIGLWCAQCWQQMGQPEKVMIVELGPGRGLLMADLLRAAKTLPAFSTAIEVHLVEVSKKLRDIQKFELADSHVTWHNDISSLPEGPAIFVANEFFDALPIRQFVFQNDHWHERLIDWRDGKLTFALEPEPRIIEGIIRTPDAGDILEQSTLRDDTAAAIGRHLSGHGGYALIIDYGFVGPGFADTLQAVKNHEYVPALAEPGVADITSHVDFDRLAKASNCQAWPTITQGVFLRRLGIDARASVLQERSEAGKIERALDRLIGDDQMGRLFKVLALGKKGAETPAGFEGRI
jgi:NADH dehydrogenase [ubiquinone] 1 alpha subcomplex assembly factor 7